MNWLNGKKTYIGIALHVLCQAVQQMAPQYAPIAGAIDSVVAEPLIAVGAAHKLAKMGE